MTAADARRAGPPPGSLTGEPGEIALTGGNSAAVVRRGDTVHRTAGPWSPTVHRLLEHLHCHGVDFVPRPRGFDEHGREVLTYLPGTVPTHPLPAYVWAPAVLSTAGRQLAQVHAATRTFLDTGPGAEDRTADAVWQQRAREPVEVVCLNDAAPYNMVFDEAGTISGWIDLDTASPGPRVWDLAHLAYRLVPLTGAADSGAGEPDLDRYRRRLAALCQTYASTGDEVAVTPAEVLAVVPERLLALAADADARHGAGASNLSGHGDFYRREAAWVDQHADRLAQPGEARLVVVTGPIASGKNTTAAALAVAASAQGRTAVVADVDDVAEMVAAPGAAALGLWLGAHQAHGALVARWLRTPVDLFIAVGPIYSPAEQAALLEPVATGTPVHWVVLDAPVTATLARAQADPTRGLSRDAAFHHDRHARFRRLRAGIPAAQLFDTAATNPDTIAREILAALDVR